ncbi:MAG: twin-arginine translocase subunit TatB [Caulobacteraceae bacterium]|nr:twin-arginine translocase subunit TatB [Caulobacter sp.]
MIPEAGAMELVFLAAVALIVVGPKDLPILLRKVGEFTRKMRGLADEFRNSFDEMARQSELDELRKEVEALREGKLSEASAAAEGEFTSVADRLAAPAWESAYGEPAPAELAVEPELPLPEPEAPPHAPEPPSPMPAEPAPPAETPRAEAPLAPAHAP